jgi:hypothetical protein
MALKSGAVWLLSRVVEGDSGESYTQNVTVYAASAQDATNLVNAEFARLRRFSTDKQRPYLPTPKWSVDKVALDEAKLISAGITQ